MERLSADPAMKKEIGRTDFVNMLTKVGEYYDAKENLSKNPADANLIAAKDAAEKSATEAVDAIGAMIDFKDVKTVADAEQLDGEYSKSIADSKTKYAPVSAAVAAKKTSLFGKDKFPTGFSAQNPWAADKKQYGVVKELSDFSTTGRKLAETVNGMKAALGAVSAQQSDKTAELSYAQKKQLRIALARMESMADEVAGHALHNEHKGQRLLQKLDEWAAQNPGGWVAPKKAKAPPPGGQQ